MGSWQDAPVVSGSWQDAPVVGQPAEASARRVIAETSNGQVYEMPNGTRGFTSPGYSTTDPAKVAEILQGARPADLVQRSVDEQRITENPVASRAVKAIEGTPFIGSYVDEAVGMFSPQAGANVRAASEAMERQRPGQSTALQLVGTALTALPMAAAGAPTLMSNAAPTIGARALQAGMGGVVLGGAEGALYGAGEGEGQERLANAGQGAMIGAGTGGVLGVAAPYVAEGVKRAIMSIRGSDVKAIRNTLGVSPAAARVIRDALDVGDMGAAADALERAGGAAMLADAGQPAQELLDAAANAGGEAGAIVRNAVEERTSLASREMMQALDNTLGSPEGRLTLQSGVREGTKEARKSAYEAAYAQPIDYAQGRGRAIAGLLARVPQSAVNRANELMRLEGAESAQILARVGDDGAVSFERLPDVRQIDYITRALNDVADQADGQGRLGGTTDVGRATANLSRQIRTMLKREVPEYRVALDTAADAISRVRATDLGYDLLKPGTRRDAVREGLRGASQAQRAAVRQGVRSYIDDTLANVTRAITDDNMEAREGIKLMRDLSSRANRQKLRLIMGREQADDLLSQIDKQTVAFELRAAVATNSRTAIRQRIQGSVDDQTTSGTLELLADGSPVQASQRFVQIFTGNTAEAQALRKQGIYEEIARALTQTRGPQARAALNFVQSAMKGNTLSEKQAAYIGTTLAGSAFLSGGHTASQALTR